MKDETERIERLLRNAPRPAIPRHLSEKLKSEVHSFPQKGPSLLTRSGRIEAGHSIGFATLWGFLRSYRLNLGGLGLAWTVILLCQITLPASHGVPAMAKLNRPSLEMFKALAEENHRLLFATFRSINPEMLDFRSAPPRNGPQKKSNAG